MKGEKLRECRNPEVKEDQEFHFLPFKDEMSTRYPGGDVK